MLLGFAVTDLLGIAGLFLAILGALAGVFRFLWSELKDLERRVRLLEADHATLRPLTQRIEQKLNEVAQHITEA